MFGFSVVHLEWRTQERVVNFGIYDRERNILHFVALQHHPITVGIRESGSRRYVPPKMSGASIQAQDALKKSRKKLKIWGGKGKETEHAKAECMVKRRALCRDLKVEVLVQFAVLAIVTAASRALGTASDPLPNVIQMAAMTAANAPEVDAPHRHVAYGAGREHCLGAPMTTTRPCSMWCRRWRGATG